MPAMGRKGRASMASLATLKDMDLRKLSARASALNAATDELNAALETIETQLNALNLGVETWLDQIPQTLAHTFVYDDSDPATSRETHDTELGYCRLADGWA